MFFYNKRFHLRKLSEAYGWKQWITSSHSRHANTIYGIKFIWCIHEYFRYFKFFVNFHQSSLVRSFKKIVYLYLRRRLIVQKYVSAPKYKKFLQIHTKYPLFLFNCRSKKTVRFWNFLQKYWSLQLKSSFKLYIKNKNFNTLKLNNWLQLKRVLKSWLYLKTHFIIKKQNFYTNRKTASIFWRTQVKKNFLATNAYQITIQKLEKSAKLKLYIYSFTITPTLRLNYFFRKCCFLLLNNHAHKLSSNKTFKITFLRIQAYLLKKMLRYLLLGLNTGSFTNVGNYYLYLLKRLHKKLTNYHLKIVFNKILPSQWLKKQKLSLSLRVWKSKTKLYLPIMHRQLKRGIATLKHFHIPVTLSLKVKSIHVNKKKLNFSAIFNLNGNKVNKKKIPRMLIYAPEFFYRFFKKFKNLLCKHMYKTRPSFTFYKVLKLKLTSPMNVEPKKIIVKKKEKKHPLWRPGLEPNTEKKSKRGYYPELKKLDKTKLFHNFDDDYLDNGVGCDDEPKKISSWRLFQNNLFSSSVADSDAFYSTYDVQQHLLNQITAWFDSYWVLHTENHDHVLFAKSFYFIQILSNIVRTSPFHTKAVKVTIQNLTLYLTSLLKKFSPIKEKDKPKIFLEILADNGAILNKRIIGVHLAYFLLRKSKKNKSLFSNRDVYSNYLFLTAKVKNSEWSKNKQLADDTHEFIYQFFRQQGFTNMVAREQLRKQITYLNLKFNKTVHFLWLWLRRKLMKKNKVTTNLSVPNTMLQQKVTITASKLKKKKFKNHVPLNKHQQRIQKRKYFSTKKLAISSVAKFNICHNVNINWFYNKNLRRKWLPFSQSWKRELVEKAPIRKKPEFTPLSFSHTRSRRKRWWNYIKKNLQIIEWFSKLPPYDRRLHFKRYRYRPKLFIRRKLKKKIYKFYYNFVCYFVPNLSLIKQNKLTLLDLKFYSNWFVSHLKKKINAKFRAKRIRKVMPNRSWLVELKKHLKIKASYNNLWYYLVTRWFKKKFRSSVDFWFLLTLEKWMKKKFNTRVQMKVINSNMYLKTTLPFFLTKQKWFFYKTKEINSAMVNLNFFQQPQFFNVIAAENLAASNNYRFALTFIKSKLSFYRTPNLHSFFFTLAGKTLRQKRMRAKTYKYISERNINTEKYFRYTFSTCCVSTPKLGSFGLSFFYSYLKLFPSNEI